jgi:hypothetical protein
MERGVRIRLRHPPNSVTADALSTSILIKASAADQSGNAVTASRSWRCKQHKPLNWIQRQMGHRTLQMLLKHYWRWTTD